MRLIKFTFISAVLLFAVVTAISLIIPSHIRLSKVINIPSQRDSIFSLLKNKDQWPRWHPSFMDSANKEMLSQINIRLLSETDSTLQLQWMQKNKKPLNMSWQLFADSNSTFATLQWSMDFYQKWYPWEKLGSMFYESNYGAMMEKGLLNIKAVIEKNQP